MDVLTNVDPCLRRGWHPVAQSSSVGEKTLDVSLLGRVFQVVRDGDGLRANAHAVADHAGLVWLAPAEPGCGLLRHAEVDDPTFSRGWLRPQRCATPAGLLADNFLDVAHFPFVHAATFGAPDEVVVPPYEVTTEPDGFSMVYEHQYDNVEDPGVAAGIRPVRQTRRVTYRYAPPFQLRLRLDHLDSGATTAILFFLQPEAVDSTAIWCCVLRDDLQGAAMEHAVAFEQTVVDEDLALSGRFLLTGLPLQLKDELHTRADAGGVALRRALAALRTSSP